MRRRRVGQRAAACAAGAAWLAALAGCQQLAILGYHLTGGETIDAKHKLTARHLAVLLDDPEGLVTQAAVSPQLQRKLAEEFTANKIETALVPYDDMERLRGSDEQAFSKMAINCIGEKVGADQVLYLRVTDFALRREPGAPLFQGRFAVRVAVLSTESKHDVRIWPRELQGEAVAFETQPQSSEGDVSAADVGRDLAAGLANNVAKLFYDHKDKS
ncbi:MAG: hypothetical protein U1A27_11840 [Phycisphaerae bacterium]